MSLAADAPGADGSAVLAGPAQRTHRHHRGTHRAGTAGAAVGGRGLHCGRRAPASVAQAGVRRAGRSCAGKPGRRPTQVAASPAPRVVCPTIDRPAAGGATGAALRHLRIENDCVAALEAERRWARCRAGPLRLCDLEHRRWRVGLCVDRPRVARQAWQCRPRGPHVGERRHHGRAVWLRQPGDVEALVAGNAIARRFGAPPADVLARAEGGRRGRTGAGGRAVPRAGAHALQPGGHARPAAHQASGAACSWHHRVLLLPRCRRRSMVVWRHHGRALLVPGRPGEQVGDYAALAPDGLRPIPRSARGPHICGSTPA